MPPSMTPQDSNETTLPRTVPSFMCDERRNVAMHLGVTEDQLKKAIRAVGAKLNSVRMYLGK